VLPCQTRGTPPILRTAASTGRTASTRDSGRNAGTPQDVVPEALWPRPRPGILEQCRKRGRIAASGAAERCAGLAPDTPRSAPQVLSVTMLADAEAGVSHAARGAISCQTCPNLQCSPENSTGQRCSTHHKAMCDCACPLPDNGMLWPTYQELECTRHRCSIAVAGAPVDVVELQYEGLRWAALVLDVPAQSRVEVRVERWGHTE